LKIKKTKNHKDRVKNNKKVKAESDTMCLYYGKVSVGGLQFAKKTQTDTPKYIRKGERKRSTNETTMNQ